MGKAHTTFRSRGLALVNEGIVSPSTGPGGSHPRHPERFGGVYVCSSEVTTTLPHVLQGGNKQKQSQRGPSLAGDSLRFSPALVLCSRPKLLRNGKTGRFCLHPTVGGKGKFVLLS